MYMNVLPVCGRYRGISRTLTIPKIKAGQDWDDLFNDFEQYVHGALRAGALIAVACFSF